jgi:SAM-dependent methyltransferase
MTEATGTNDAATTTSNRPEPGHWLLARLGKRVLRPGGIELARWLLRRVAVGAGDHVVELGPGVGRTAELLLVAGPERYVGREPNPAAREALRPILRRHPATDLIDADASDTGLPAASATVVVGDALLTMQSPDRKRAIVEEACRLLRPGGRYAIHEMSLQPDDLGDEARKQLVNDLGRSIKVGAQPLTVPGWRALLEDSGLEVLEVDEAPMRLLETSRLVRDEGVVGTARFVTNLLRDGRARERVLAMRASFRAHADELAEVAIVARRLLVPSDDTPENTEIRS